VQRNLVAIMLRPRTTTFGVASSVEKERDYGRKTNRDGLSRAEREGNRGRGLCPPLPAGFNIQPISYGKCHSTYVRNPLKFCTALPHDPDKLPSNEWYTRDTRDDYKCPNAMEV